MNQLMARRGYAQIGGNEHLRTIIEPLIGKALSSHIRIGNLKRGVLELYAADSVTMQELTFKKRKLLRGIQAALPEGGFKDIRFRVSV
ncbi:hypothetical protein FF011L_00040 [Roseimaritima multifibrata]|uniref:DUF721 domain-containing protein n=1 Tax=Roseimaritima multifibrata TaxID=1930274 RepID=A0A517M8R1_9BACT|nr:DUF721 domain-containing protein [Roseimaritima multifibrata]QDS91275.1 hypothetical protein FF011L_00040 [Roseimaritima multifibrata]